MKKRVITVITAFMMGAMLTACGSGEPASAPSVADNDKAAVQEKLNKQDSNTETTTEKSEDTSAESEVVSEAVTDAATSENEPASVGTIDKGNTQIVAEFIASEVGADSFHIETVASYPADYDECCDVAKQEQADKARPEIQDGVENMEQYDIVFLGYPIWWGDMPMAVYTFMDEGSGESGTYSAIGSYLPNAQVLDGMAIQGKTAQKFSSDTQQAVRDWLDGLGL